MVSKSFSRKIKRIRFNAGTIPLLRNYRIIWRTPKIKGRRLVLKSRAIDSKREREGRNALKVLHDAIDTKTYTFRLSKRFPQIQGQRTELYYDRPSLKELMEKKMNRRVKVFLKANNLGIDEASDRATEAFEELSDNIGLYGLKELDFGSDQLMADSFTVGKMNLICIDL